MKLLAVDLSGIFHANWHATADRELGAAFELTVSKVQKYASAYDRVVVAVDRPPYRRKEIYPAYKAQRDKPADDLLDQLRRVEERMRADGYAVIGVPGAEADDVIATVVMLADGRTSIDILSGDKDLLQLVSDECRVAVISPRTGNRIRDDDVIENPKLGVPPSLIADLLALTGDSSDSVPGVPSVGPKTAAALLTEHGDLPGVLNALSLGKIGGAVGAKMLEHLNDIQTSYKLVQLDANLPIEWEEVVRERKPEPLSGPVDAEFEEQPEEPEKGEANPEPRKPSVAIVRHTEWDQALEPTDLRQADWLAAKVLDSRAFGVSNRETALAVILKGRAMGIDAITSLSNFHIIKGRPVMSAQLIIGLVKASPKCELFQLVKTTNDEATWKTRRNGEGVVEMTWTLEDARRADLLRKSRSGELTQWEKMPRTMLRWRCGVELARAVYPDIVAGVYSEDEAAEF